MSSSLWGINASGFKFRSDSNISTLDSNLHTASYMGTMVTTLLLCQGQITQAKYGYFLFWASGFVTDLA